MMPACVVNAICLKFPKLDNVYTGFQTIVDYVNV